MADASKADGLKIPVQAALNGPGPLAYNLKRTLGTHDHDVSMKQQPSWSIGMKHKQTRNTIPGPGYDIGDRVTHRGRSEAPAHSIAGRPPPKSIEILPGPGAYNGEVRKGVLSSEANPKAASIGSRDAWYNMKNWAPSSSKYNLPSPLGSGTTTLKGASSWSMYGRKDYGSPHYEGTKQKQTPGPAAYSATDNDVMMKKSASFSMQGRTKSKDYNTAKLNPGPGAYNPSIQSKGSGRTMGIRHSPYTVLCLTMADVQM